VTEKPGTWLKVFCPEARCLTDEEVASLPAEQRQAMKDKQGLWLEMFCPDESCLSPEESGVEIKKGVKVRGEEGVWLSLFCPEGLCQAKEGTDLA